MTTRGEPPRKRVKTDSTKQPTGFASGDAVREALQNGNPDELAHALVTLRNQLTVRPHEGPIAPSDTRLVLLQSYLDSPISRDAKQLFDAWSSTSSKQPQQLAAPVSALAAILTLLSSHYTFHALGHPIVKTLLSSPWIHHLNTYLSSSSNELVIATLKCFLALSTFAGGKEQRALMDAFAWESKSLHKLLSMRRRTNTKSTHTPNPLAQPDIRTLYMLLHLSFLSSTSPASVKLALLSGHREQFVALFKGLPHDPPAVVSRLLETSWTGIWGDARVPRAVKVGIFGEATLGHITKLYERAQSEDDSAHTPAELAHHFLLALCTRPGTGVCFRDRGWYPRDTSTGDAVTQPSQDAADDDDTVAPETGKGQIHNRILSHLLKSLRAADDPRQRELALRILAACPELVAGYSWPALEPRLSSRWISNIAFLREVVGLPVPVDSFLLHPSSTATAASSTSVSQDQTQHNPIPPPLSALLSNALPTAQLKTHLNKGLQAHSPLVQHASALALARCLEKYAQIQDALHKVSEALGEDIEIGNWARRSKEFADGARRRVPEFSVIVAFAQGVGKPDLSDGKGAGEGAEVKEGKKKNEPNSVRDALLNESAARLLWLYHRALPQLIAETRFDPGKLMARLTKSDTEDSEAGGLAVLTQLHTLRLLQETDGFVWSGKIGGRSHLLTLLTLYATTSTAALRPAAQSLLTKLLSQSVLFQHSSDEVHAWLNALPTRGRSEDAVAADGTPLTDERIAVLAFLDDCVQRCLKTPYRYMDDLTALLKPESEKDVGEAEQLSPLLATLVEQLRAKVYGALVSPSDTLALATYAKRLLYLLAAQGRNLRALSHIGARIENIVEGLRDGAIGGAVQRQARDAASCAEFIGRARYEAEMVVDEDEEQTAAVRQFLRTVEQLPPADVDAGELVDWLRLLRSPLPATELARVVRFIAAHALDSAVVREMWESVPVERSPLSSATFWQDVGTSCDTAPFDVLFLHATASLLRDNAYRARMATAALRAGDGGVNPALHLACHRLDALGKGTIEDEGASLLLLLSEISASLPPAERGEWRSELYKTKSINGLLAGTPETRVREALAELLRSTLNGRSPADIALLSPFISSCIARGTLDGMTLVLAPYMREDAARIVLNLLVRAQLSDEARALLAVLVRTLRRALDGNSVPTAQTLNDLITLHIRYPDLDILEQVIASSLSACIPLGLAASLDADLDLQDFQTIGAVVAVAEKRWSNRLDGHEWTQSAEVFLRRDPNAWTDDTATILECMTYLDPGARDAVGRFLSSAQSEDVDATYLARLMRARLDAAPEPPVIEEQRAISHFTRILTTDDSDALVLMTARFPTLHKEFAQALTARLKISSKKAISPSLVHFAERWSAAEFEAVGDACSAVFEHGLRWAARALAAPGSFDNSVLSALGRLGVRVSVKAHLLDVVLAAVVQNRMDDVYALDFAEALTSRAQMKPVIVNRHLQTIVQHPDFYRRVAASSPSRFSLVHLIHTLFHLHPSNTCQPSHIQPLILAYTGSQSRPDRWIFDIFRLYEQTRKVSVAPLFARWSATDGTAGTSLQALLNLDASQVFRSCLAFPVRAKATVFSAEQGGGPFTAEQVYEPVFVVSLLAHTLAGEIPQSALEWVALFRTNAVSLAVRCLSSEDADLRHLATNCLASLRVRLDAFDMQEGPQTKYILDLLKDAVKLDSDADHYARIPAFTALLLAHALRAVFYPANFIYPLTSRFLLQRPELDTSDVPMLYSMLHSGTDEWKRERSWMLKFLSDAMLGAGAIEWEIFRRRRTWDLLASLWQNDRAVRSGVLDILVNLTSSRHIVTGLILKSALLAWMEMVLLVPQVELSKPWLAVMENILVVADTAKLEAATSGEWRLALARCLASLVHHQGSELGVLNLQSRVLLRLSQLSSSIPQTLTDVLSECVDRLVMSEQKIRLEVPGVLATQDRQSAKSLHSSLDSQGEDKKTDLSRWCDTVLDLWRVAMTLQSGGKTWDRLTARIVLARTLLGGVEIDAGEVWAHEQTIFNIGLN